MKKSNQQVENLIKYFEANEELHEFTHNFNKGTNKEKYQHMSYNEIVEKHNHMKQRIRILAASINQLNNQ